ncbi:hypothetical protein EJ08DRAFT_659621 [Tothia fuscella]|uniref:Uncharacterized protein n=1 Tax=Tothia fuscella TaxID=1048955 RepID=A0A9P4NUK7_9PEZI|nr:hypothetical protein EJ08DRAFT_659621 [Tothia fuscella]
MGLHFRGESGANLTGNATHTAPSSDLRNESPLSQYSRNDDVRASDDSGSLAKSTHSQPETFPTDLPERPQGTNRPQGTSIFSRVGAKIKSQVDPAAIFHLLDFRPWFYPFTWKKYGVLLMLACIIAGIVVSDHYTKWITKSMAITRSYMLPVLIISVCAEPLIIMIILPVAKVPDIPQHEVNNNLNLESDLEKSEKTIIPHGPFESALVIPCHDTDHQAMRTTIDSALPHFRPQDIYIVDNGRSKYPSHPDGNFREYIRSIHPDIEYMWSPIGSKNAAQLVGALAARNKGYKYLLSVDDDVCIPKNFSAPTEMIDDKFKAVAYPIKAMDAKCEVPLFLVAWQDVEYRLSGLSKLAEDRLCGVQFPHGAGWFVELDTFIELMEFYHPMDFIAEDCNAGLGIAKMGKGIRFDARCYLATEVPTTFFGSGLNWWKQRQKSWEMGRHGRIFAFIRAFLFSMPPRMTVQGILWHKFSFFYLICTILIDWLRVPVIVALGRTSTWWRNCLLLMLFSALPPMAYNYWKCRRRADMQIRFWAGLTYPWYKQLYLFVALAGAIRWAGYFLGGHQAPPTIQQMLKAKDERCFWLDPRFKENPAYLADEAEAIEAAKKAGQDPMERPTDGTSENSPLRPDFLLEPPSATYSSAATRSIELELPRPSSSRAGSRPRGSPSMDPFADSRPTSPLPIFEASNDRNALSQETLITNPFADPKSSPAPSPRMEYNRLLSDPEPRPRSPRGHSTFQKRPTFSQQRSYAAFPSSQPLQFRPYNQNLLGSPLMAPSPHGSPANSYPFFDTTVGDSNFKPQKSRHTSLRLPQSNMSSSSTLVPTSLTTPGLRTSASSDSLEAALMMQNKSVINNGHDSSRENNPEAHSYSNHHNFSLPSPTEQKMAGGADGPEYNRFSWDECSNGHMQMPDPHIQQAYQDRRYL